MAAVLFGRSGSVALPGKNVARLLGRPSLHYPLMAACASGIVTDLFVSTDSEEIARLAQPFGARRIRRPAQLASNSALLQDAIKHAFDVIDADSGGAYDRYLILLCNAVTVRPERIAEAAAMLDEDAQADSVTTVAKWNMFSPVRAWSADASRPGALAHYVPLELLGQATRISCDRDKSKDCYFCDHSLTLARRETLARMAQHPGPFPWMGQRIRCIEQRPGSGDIDLPWQVPVAEWWLAQHGFSAERVPYSWKPLRREGRRARAAAVGTRA